jgi:hypothetical protein
MIVCTLAEASAGTKATAHKTAARHDCENGLKAIS